MILALSIALGIAVALLALAMILALRVSRERDSALRALDEAKHHANRTLEIALDVLKRS